MPFGKPGSDVYGSSPSYACMLNQGHGALTIHTVLTVVRTKSGFYHANALGRKPLQLHTL